MGHNLETRSLLDELKSFDRKGGLFDLGHPLLNRMAESFVKAAGIGAVQAVSWDAYFTAKDGAGANSNSTSQKKHRFSELKGETNKNSVEALIKRTGKGSLQWGLAASMYSEK